MHSGVLLLTVATAFLLDMSTSQDVVVNGTNSMNNTTYDINATEPAITVNKNCSLRPDNEKVKQKIQEYLADGTKMIEYTLIINNTDRVFHDDIESHMYKPFFWVRVTGRHGTSLLALRPEYDKLSLYSLAVGVKEMNITLIEEPASCLSQLTYPEIETLIRELVMHDFQDPKKSTSAELGYTESVCNMHIVNNEGMAEFQYYCCKPNDNGEIECTYLHSDFWLNVLLGVIFTVKVLIMLYSPKLIPTTLYNQKKAERNFKFRHEMKLKAVIKTNNPDDYKTAQVFQLRKFRKMPAFNETLKSMKPDVPYSMQMNELNLLVKHERILPSDYAPVRLFRSLYDSILGCKVSENKSVNPCCKTDVFKMFRCCCSGHTSWRSLLRRIMKMIIILFLAAPWIVRVFIYYEVENTEMSDRTKAAEQRDLDIEFPGNVTLYLTPVHIVFIVIYAMLTFETCVFKLIGERAQARFKLVFVRCLNDMRSTSQLDVISWLVRGAVAPCTRLGVVGVFVGLFAWVLALPVIICIVAFYTLPTINVSGRMLAHMVAYLLPNQVCSNIPSIAKCKNVMNKIEDTLEMKGMRKEDSLARDEEIMKSPRMKIEQVIVILMCLAAFISVIFLLMEFAAFIIEIFVYTFMGVIVNADYMLTYVSLAFLMGVYAQDCFGFVSKKFLNFNQSLNSVTLSQVDEVKRDIYMDEESQPNMAYQIISHDDVPNEQDTYVPVALERNMDGYPRWNIPRLCLFLDRKDKPYIPRGYFFDACTDLKYHMAPGKLVLNYLHAVAELSVIVVFLLLVLVVVLAFGDTYELSAGNKMLATIAGGILPFLLRNIVFKSHDAPKITSEDTGTILFKAAFHSFLKQFKQTWPIADINVAELTQLGEEVVTEDNADDTIDVPNGTEMMPLVKASNGSTSNGTGLNGTVLFKKEDIDFVIDCREEHKILLTV